MKNQEVAKIFYEIADYLEMEDVAFKPYAYRRAGMSLETLEKDISEIYKENGIKGLMNIPGIGEALAKKTEEYLKTGRLRHYEDLKKKTPVNMEELVGVEGIGPKKVKVLYEKLGIRNLKDLERAAKHHKIAGLFGFGEKTEKNILQGIRFLRRDHGRFLLGTILPKAEEVLEQLKKIKEVEKISLGGSLRRMKETIGDVDFLVVSPNSQKIMDYFVTLPAIVKIWGKGPTKSSVRMKEGFDMDIRVIPCQSYGAALQYFTGSKEHNIILRKIAIEKGLKLNEYGVFKGKKMIKTETEEEVYKILGLRWMPPEIRENQGEIEAAKNNKLPKIIDIKDIKGDLHCHSNWDGGVNSIEEIAEEALRIGYEYIGIADHTKFLRIENGLDEKRILQRNYEIEKIGKKKLGIKILKGCEANIMPDGSIDIKDEVLSKLDYVIAGVHSSFKMTREEMTKRIIKAMKNPNVDIISHPTGRLIQRRDEYQIDFEEILKMAKSTKTILEINAYPDRLDLNDLHIRQAKGQKVKMIINTDAHHIDQMKVMRYGVAQARRGWAEKDDIVNTYALDKLIKYFKKNAAGFC